MFRSQSPRLWSFRAALDDVADMLTDIGAARRSGSSHRQPADYRTSSDRLSPALNEIVASQACGAPLSQVARAYAGYMAPDRSEGNRSADAAAGFKDILQLKPRLTPKELKYIRRVFAKYHHPDCVPEHLRVAAGQNMAMVNALVDGALANEKAMRAKNVRS